MFGWLQRLFTSTSQVRNEPEFPVYETPLVVLLVESEKEKGSPLTKDEVHAVRDNAEYFMAPESLAAEYFKQINENLEVPLPILNPDRIWEEWQWFRSLRDSEGSQ